MKEITESMEYFITREKCHELKLAIDEFNKAFEVDEKTTYPEHPMFIILLKDENESLELMDEEEDFSECSYVNIGIHTWCNGGSDESALKNLLRAHGVPDTGVEGGSLCLGVEIFDVGFQPYNDATLAYYSMKPENVLTLPAEMTLSVLPECIESCNGADEVNAKILEQAQLSTGREMSAEKIEYIGGGKYKLSGIVWLDSVTELPFEKVVNLDPEEVAELDEHEIKSKVCESLAQEFGFSVSSIDAITKQSDSEYFATGIFWRRVMTFYKSN